MNIGLIGKGYWGKKLLKYIDEEFTLKHVIESSSMSPLPLFQDRDTPAVIIATPIGTHYKLVKEALRHYKYVFCEKPMCVNYKNALELRTLSEIRKRGILVDYTYTFSPGFSNIPSIVNGDIEHIEMHSKQLGRFTDYDVRWLLASHQLALLDMIVPIDEMKFTSYDIINLDGVVTSCEIRFDFGRIFVSLNHPIKEVYTDIYGDGMFLRYDFTKGKVNHFKYDKAKRLSEFNLIKSKSLRTVDENNNLRHALRHFKRMIYGDAGSNIERAINIINVLSRM